MDEGQRRVAEGQESAVKAPESWTVSGRDGLRWEFEVERGSLSAVSTGKYERASSATLTHPDGGKSFLRWNEFDGHMQIASISLRPEMRGSGVGLELYRRVLEEAIRAGKGLHSDSSVSTEALKLYPKLEKMGHRVEYAPDGDVVGVAHAPRGEDDVSRAAGSSQWIGRGDRPIARVLAPHEPSVRTLPPAYLMEVLFSAPQSSIPASPAGPPPLPPAIGPSCAPPFLSNLGDKLRSQRGRSVQADLGAPGRAPKL